MFRDKKTIKAVGIRILRKFILKTSAFKRSISLKLKTTKRWILRTILFSLPAVFFTFLLLEIITRLLLNPSDAPDIYFDKSLGNVFLPNQTGVYTKNIEPKIMAKFRINNFGWNSPNDYVKSKQTDTYRIAVIGDSFIEALQVDYDIAYPYLLENLLNQKNSKNKNIEVYSFGHSGSNLIHYTHLAEYAISNFQPDLVIINVVGNDYKESFCQYARTDNWSLCYRNGVLYEKTPGETFGLLIKKVLRKSALLRYLTINLDLVNNSPIISRLFYMGIRNNYTHSQHLDSEEINVLIDYTANKLLDLQRKQNTSIMLVLDSDRNSIYKGDDPSQTEHGRLNSSLKQAAASGGVAVLDLSSVFQKEWQAKKEKFDWETDEHWNEYANRVIANALFNKLITNQKLK